MGINNKQKTHRKGLKHITILLMVVVILAMAFTTSFSFGAVDESNKDGALKAGRGDEIIVEYSEDRIEEIPYETFYLYSENLSAGESKVKTQGQNGTQRVVGTVTTRDGKIVARKIESTTVLKEPTDEVILVGSLSAIPDIDYHMEEVESFIEVSYDVSTYVELDEKPANDGEVIVRDAMQYIGNPYVWGGTSLTGGCDCSGFVYSLFNNRGYEVPRVGAEYVYPIVSGEMLPGDVILYPEHYSIYIGGGMEISALNSRVGICITPVGLLDSYYLAVRIAQ